MDNPAPGVLTICWGEASIRVEGATPDTAGLLRYQAKPGKNGGLAQVAQTCYFQNIPCEESPWCAK